LQLGFRKSTDGDGEPSSFGQGRSRAAAGRSGPAEYVWQPRYGGVIVLESDAQTLRMAIDSAMEEERRLEAEAKLNEVVGRWSRLVRGAVRLDRIRTEYSSARLQTLTATADSEVVST
jgi:hypothetical protein